MQSQQAQRELGTTGQSTARTLQEMLDRARELMKQRRARRGPRHAGPAAGDAGESAAGTQQAQQSPGEQTLSDLQKMIQMQQQLLDRSFQMDRDQRQGQQQQGQQGSKASSSRASRQQGAAGPGRSSPMGQAAAEQEALRRALGELMRRHGRGGDGDPARARARPRCRCAAPAARCSRPRRAQAAELQTQAIDAMQRGGQAMMEQLQEQMAQQQGEGPGRPAAAPAAAAAATRSAGPRATRAARHPRGAGARGERARPGPRRAGGAVPPLRRPRPAAARARLLPPPARPVLRRCGWRRISVAELRRAPAGAADRHAGAALYRHGTAEAALERLRDPRPRSARTI